MSKVRCQWCPGDSLYENYHDKEWGVPIYDEQKLFEFLTLEIFQAGLSWITILRKRENFYNAFDQFDYVKIAEYGSDEITSLKKNTGIIRNKLKIEAAINNAKAFIKIQKIHGSFSKFIWAFVDGKPLINTFKTQREIPHYTPLANKICKVLKKEGFKFLGPTVIYAFMQATGMVNDHLIDCFRYDEILETY
ncbi:MAG: DNA-3-methyladenine glycosylase I [Flavobacteriaceae bacterium]|nr:DNA-3-methyladenine glycosylase I [Flavobacteriaceae bacterium]